MTAILLFFLIGIALLAADVFASSFILAVAGGGAMLAGCALAYRHFGPAAASLAGLTALALLGLTVYLELFLLPRTRFGRGLVVHSTSGAAPVSPFPAAAEITGKTVEAVTTLAPSGYVAFDGRRYEAFCRSGHAAKGAALVVVGVDNFRLIVTQA